MKYIYIISASHSGSTLLDLILSNAADVFSMGEAAKLHRAVRMHKKCSCKRPVSECSVWKPIIETFSAREIKILSYGDVGYKWNNVSIQSEFAEKYPVFLNKVVEGTGMAALCDSSKKLLRLKQLSKMTQFNLYVLYLKRHPGGVGSSQTKKGRSFYFHLMLWLKHNYEISRFLKKLGVAYKQIIYENLVADSKKEMKAVFDFIGMDHDPEKIDDFAKLRHLISGNRMRMEHQRQKIFPPKNWRISLTSNQVLVADYLNKFSKRFYADCQ